MPIPYSKVVDLVIDATYNEPNNNPSRQELARRHDLDDADVRQAYESDAWHQIQDKVLGAIVQERIAHREQVIEAEIEAAENPDTE